MTARCPDRTDREPAGRAQPAEPSAAWPWALTFTDTPLWSGIYLLPLTVGFVTSGSLSGWLSDKHGARAFASGGLLLSAAAFGGLLMLPTDFRYAFFAILIFLAGAGMGLFSAPNAAAIMNSVPARQRGAASGMLATFRTPVSCCHSASSSR